MHSGPRMAERQLDGGRPGNPGTRLVHLVPVADPGCRENEGSVRAGERTDEPDGGPGGEGQG